jgi:predicted urease superfamily metal-dependent hydrolase
MSYYATDPMDCDKDMQKEKAYLTWRDHLIDDDDRIAIINETYGNAEFMALVDAACPIEGGWCDWSAEAYERIDHIRKAFDLSPERVVDHQRRADLLFYVIVRAIAAKSEPLHTAFEKLHEDRWEVMR